VESLDNWFEREILAHEAALLRYLKRIWPHREDIHDLRQDVYIRVYEAAGKSRPVSPKSFLFTTARNLIVDRLRRGRIVAIEAMGDLEVLNVPVEGDTPELQLQAREEVKLLAHAFELLPPRCQQVVWMRRVDDLPQRVVADRLGIGQKTVEKHLMKGVRLLADMLYGERSGPAPRGRRETSEHENGHGKQHKD
jgi:RNA polymerase sigma-70 factor (ECF subfamily)